MLHLPQHRQRNIKQFAPQITHPLLPLQTRPRVEPIVRDAVFAEELAERQDGLAVVVNDGVGFFLGVEGRGGDGGEDEALVEVGGAEELWEG